MRRVSLALTLVMVALAGLTLPAYAQDNGPIGAIGDGSLNGQPLPAQLPAYLVRDAQGQIQFNANGLTPGEPIVQDPPPGFWKMAAPVPGTDITVCAGCLVYNTYTTAAGETVVVPNAYTAIVMAVTGYSPFEARPELAIGNGFLQIAAMTGAFEGMGIPPEQFTLESLAQRFNPLSNEFDPWFMLQLNVALNDPNSPLNSGAFFWASGLFQYACNPVTGDCPSGIPPERICPAGQICEPCPDCAATSTCPAGLRCENREEHVCEVLGDCRPLTGVCPDRDFRISAPAPQYAAQKLAPDFPIVVGQDPAERGVDVRAGVSVPVVTVSFNVEREYPGELECQWVGNGQGGGCPADTKGFQPWMEKDADWGAVDTSRKVCERVTKTYPDPVTNFSARLQLDGSSIAWIETGDLQQRYPGAKVYQAVWPLWPGRPPLRQSVAADRTSLTLEWEKLPLRDPGQYHVVLAGLTAGTPYTAPRTLAFDEIVFDVALFETALIK